MQYICSCVWVLILVNEVLYVCTSEILQVIVICVKRCLVHKFDAEHNVCRMHVASNAPVECFHNKCAGILKV